MTAAPSLPHQWIATNLVDELQYWIVDPETDAVEVWDFAASAQELARFPPEP